MIPFLFFLSAQIAAAELKPEEVIQKFQVLGLGSDKHWHRLLHFVNGEGQIDSSTFYLSKEGKKNPQAELNEFIKILLSESPDLEEQKSVQCRFPARTYYVHKKLEPYFKLPVKNCPQFLNWFQTLRGSSVSLVFSSYFLNNPSSMFGHTFLRINKAPSGKDGKRYELLDYGVNYAANATTSNPILYPIMGLFGGFPGTFTTVPYYYKVREYNNAESRDLWEYEINISPQATDLLVAHVWEVGPTYADYWYLTENCSYFVLTLIEAADPNIEITKYLKKYVIPTDTVLVAWQIPNLVKSFTYRPSVRSELFARLDRLSEDEKKIVALVTDEKNTEPLGGLADNRKKDVLDTLIDSLDYRYPVQVQMPETSEAQFKNKVLTLRSKVNEISEPLQLSPSPREYPHLGHGSRRIGMGLKSSKLNGDSYLLNYKFAHHELTDPDQGYPEYAQITFFDFRFQYDFQHRKMELEKLTIFEVISLTTYSLFTRAPAWRLNVGVSEFTNPDCPKCLGPAVSGGAGYALGFLQNEKLIAYLGIKAGLFYDKKLFSGLGPQTTIKMRWSQNWISLLEAWHRKDFNVSYLDWNEVQFTTQYNFKWQENDVGIKISAAGQGHEKKSTFEFFYYY